MTSSPPATGIKPSPARRARTPSRWAPATALSTVELRNDVINPPAVESEIWGEQGDDHINWETPGRQQTLRWWWSRSDHHGKEPSSMVTTSRALAPRGVSEPITSGTGNEITAGWKRHHHRGRRNNIIFECRRRRYLWQRKRHHRSVRAMVSSGGGNVLLPGAGNDTVNAGAGNDYIQKFR